MPLFSDDNAKRFMVENFGQYLESEGVQSSSSLGLIQQALQQPLLLKELIDPRVRQCSTRWDTPSCFCLFPDQHRRLVPQARASWGSSSPKAQTTPSRSPFVHTPARGAGIRHGDGVLVGQAGQIRNRAHACEGSGDAAWCCPLCWPSAATRTEVFQPSYLTALTPGCTAQRSTNAAAWPCGQIGPRSHSGGCDRLSQHTPGAAAGPA